MRFEIPAALPTWNIFYAGRHWTERVKLKEHWRTLTYDALGEDVVMFEKPVHITVHCEAKRTAPDVDNLCAKFVIDHLKGKILYNDDPLHVAGITFYAAKSSRDHTTFEIIEV